jgi:copper homeostasis protein
MNPKIIQVEVCSYSLFSCQSADRAGANRIELCGSPWEGGTTPSIGLVKASLATCDIEIHTMLRPRGGDFCYDAAEKDTMLFEIEPLIKAGVHGLVMGALLPNGDIDFEFVQKIRQETGNLPLTFHRAIDVSRNPFEVIKALIEVGFSRILTSGCKNKAHEGIEMIADMVNESQARIEIMAGSGVSPTNCLDFVSAGVNAIHLSARTTKNSLMEYRRPGISMGGVSEISEFEIAYSNEELIRQTVQKINSIN